MTTSPAMVDGIVGVPSTPFTDDNRVDTDSLRRYVRHALDVGAVGFLAPAVAGEVDQLSEAEREEIVTTLLSECAGRAPVIGGATDPDPEGRLRHVRRFIELGCQGVLAYVPYEDKRSYTAAVHALGGLNPGFLMIQDLDLGAAPLPVPLIARLHREVPSFKWIKVETGDRCRKISAILDATGGALRVGTAGPDLIELLDRGVHAYLSTYTPGVYHRIWELHRGNRRNEAMALYRRLLPCLTFMATHQKIQWRFTKALLQADGIFAHTHVRIDAPELDPVETRLVEELARYATALERDMPGNQPSQDASQQGQ